MSKQTEQKSSQISKSNQKIQVALVVPAEKNEIKFLIFRLFLFSMLLSLTGTNPS